MRLGKEEETIHHQKYEDKANETLALKSSEFFIGVQCLQVTSCLK